MPQALKTAVQREAEADEFARRLLDLYQRGGEGGLTLAINLARETGRHKIVYTYALGLLRAVTLLLKSDQTVV